MDPHGVDVFDEADGDHLIFRVADDFQFEFLPTLDRFFDQHLSDDTGRKTPRRHFTELVHIVNEPSSGTAHRIGGPHDRRQADTPENGLRLLQRVRDFALGHGNAQTIHRVFEGLSVLAAFDGVDLDADHLHAVFFQHARLVQLGGEVQSRLTAKIRQQCIRPLFLDDFGHCLDRKRFDVRHVGRSGVGHDRGRVGVGQNDLVAETPQRLARLRAGIVEFTRLTDDDRTGTDDHHFFISECFGTGLLSWQKAGLGFSDGHGGSGQSAWRSPVLKCTQSSPGASALNRRGSGLPRGISVIRSQIRWSVAQGTSTAVAVRASTLWRQRTTMIRPNSR